MALATYTDLQASVANWLHRTDLTDVIPDLIVLAEARIARDLRLRSQVVSTTLSTVANQRTVTFPTDWLEFENVTLVGDPDTGYIAIDPGPADPDHIDKLWRAARGDIRMIVCTHSHPDHSPGARPLQMLCEQHGKATPPLLGLPSAPTARTASEFTPDRSLLNNELLTLKR